MESRVVLVGIGTRGWADVPEAHRDLILDAPGLVGDADVLAEVPAGTSRTFAQAREPWPDPVATGVRGLLERHPRVVALVRGDPLGSGRARELAGAVAGEPALLRIEPGVPPASLARARLGIPDAEVLDLRRLSPATLARELAPDRVLIVLLPTDPSGLTGVVDVLLERGYGDSAVAVLGTTDDPDPTAVAELMDARPEGRGPIWALGLHLHGPVVSSWSAGLPDASLSRPTTVPGGAAEVDERLTALARLAPQPGAMLWDLGSGGGVLAVEWLLAHPTCRALAVEADRAGVEAATANAARSGVPRLEVALGGAVLTLVGRPAPDAVYLREPASGLVALCQQRLRPGGRLVVQASGDADELMTRWRAEGGELTRIAVQRAMPGGWAEAVAVTQWAWRRHG